MSDDEAQPSFRLGVLGVGNPLMADEGVGPEVIAALKNLGVPRGVELEDVGSAGMSLLHIIRDYDAAIVVDAADFGGEPGEVRAFRPDEVSSVKQMRRESLHEADLLQVVELSRTLGELPDPFYMVGVQFSLVEMGREMTSEVRGAIPVAVKTVMDLVENILAGGAGD
jgi:hydrogenase maturation protease